VSVATRASARGQAPRGRSHSACISKEESGSGTPQTFYFLHPAAGASERFFSFGLDRRRCTISNMKTKQASVLAQSCQQQRRGRGKTLAPSQVNLLQNFDIWKTLRRGQKGSPTLTIVTPIERDRQQRYEPIVNCAIRNEEACVLWQRDISKALARRFAPSCPIGSHLRSRL
jgi:hypothetical protein